MSRGTSFAIAVILAVVALTAECRDPKLTEVVDTESGPVQGQILPTLWGDGEYASFKGIPFAAPPVGKLRFRPPQPVEPWTEVRPALEHGSVCIQRPMSMENIARKVIGMPLQDEIVGSEDCLYLNVYTPRKTFGDSSDTELLPVMVWIYGGGFVSGYSNTTLYGPELLIRNDVVIVSMNYRLAALGFLTTEHPEIQGNAGLKDQTFALKWVQKNIKAFGGDPNQVTIFGESAGGASIIYQLLSPMAKGLFNQSISMSGSPLAPWAYRSRKVALANTDRLLKQLGYKEADSGSVVDFLQSVPVEEILRATSDAKASLDAEFVPTAENPKLGESGSHFIVECPYNLLKKLRFDTGPHMIGGMKDETITFAAALPKMKKFITDVLMTIMDATATTSLLGGLVVDQTVETSTDILFRVPMEMTRKMMQKNTNLPLYYYQMSYTTEYALHKLLFGIEVDGAAHVDDIGFLFHIEGMGTKVPQDKDHELNVFRRKLASMWTNFAKYGNPTPASENQQLGITWQPSGKRGLYLDIKEKSVMKSSVLSAKAKLYEYFSHLATPIVGGCSLLG